MDGNVEIEVSYTEYQKISEKKFLESAPTYEVKNLIEDQLRDTFYLLTCQFEDEELIQEAYEGDYGINGKTSEGISLKATVANPNLKVRIENDSLSKKREEASHSPVSIALRDLFINSGSTLCIAGSLIEIDYGLVNVEIFRNFHGKIESENIEVSIVQDFLAEKTNAKSLNAKIILRSENSKERNHNHSNDGQVGLETYCCWIMYLLSFASGKYIDNIYSTKTFTDGQSYARLEHWPGGRNQNGGRGISVIQSPHIPEFIRQCMQKLDKETFVKKGLGLALCWYLDAFSTNVSEIKLLLRCTVLESLNKKYSSMAEDSRRIISRPLYRKVRKLILKTISDFASTIEDEGDKEKYRIFEAKVKKPFEEAYYNQMGNLRASLKEMLEFYGVPYKDLFPNLEFVKIRDSVVHEGFAEEGMDSVSQELQSLVVRLFLAILNYEGDYMESRKIETKSGSRNKYGLICKSFPFDVKEAK